LISEFVDIYFFNPDELLKENGFAEKKVALIKKSIEKSKQKPFPILLSSLGIREIGKQTIDSLVKAGFTSIDKLIAQAEKYKEDAFLHIEGIGPKMSKILASELSSPRLKKIIKKLKEAKLQLSISNKNNTKNSDKILTGMKFGITGTLSIGTRNRIIELIIKNGGEFTGSISRKTTHIIVGNSPGSKLEKAKKIGIKIISEEEFIKLINYQS